MKIAVTGANGFLGSKLVSRLTGYKRQTVALLRPNADRSLLSRDQEIRELDYSNPASIRTAISDCEVVIHNAGKTRTLRFEEMLAANLGITAKLIEAVNGWIHQELKSIHCKGQDEQEQALFRTRPLQYCCPV